MVRQYWIVLDPYFAGQEIYNVSDIHNNVQNTRQLFDKIPTPPVNQACCHKRTFLLSLNQHLYRGSCGRGPKFMSVPEQLLDGIREKSAYLFTERGWDP
ncbi:hypothetical protein C5167_004164 [Papaver somniferum]|nr:hypothetical protein C5167_004164 [Papaver somniferum]